MRKDDTQMITVTPRALEYMLHAYRRGDMRHSTARQMYIDAIKVLEEPLAALGINNIEVIYPHGTPYVAPLDDKFRVVIWSHPNMDVGRNLVLKRIIFGKEITDGTTVYRTDVYAPDAMPFPPIPIVTPDGDTLAELVLDMNALYILYDAAHYGEQVEYEIWCQIMNEAAEQLSINSSSDAAEKRKELAEQRRIEAEKRKAEEAKKRFVSLISQRTERQIADAEARLRSTEGYIRDYKTELVRYIRSLDDIQRQVTALKKDTTDYEAKALKEFELMSNLHGVERFEIEGDKLKVYTPQLKCFSEKGNAYQLGRFRIEIALGTSDVRFFGLDREYLRRGYWTSEDPHPHVSGDNGRPCIGNLAETIAVLTGQYEIAALTSVLVNWLESCNTNDPAGANVVRWDRVDPDTGALISEGADDDEDWVCPGCDADTDDDEIYACHHCGTERCGDCIVWVESAQRYVCRRCYDEQYARCAHCEDDYLRSDMYETADGLVCNTCFEDSYSVCVECGETFHDNDTTYLENYGHRVCHSCLEVYYTRCDECDEYTKNSELVDGVCEECRDEDGYEPQPAAALDRNDALDGLTIAYAVHDELATAVVAGVTADAVTCQFCRVALLPEQLMTCESCGEQGCDDCIYIDEGGMYACPNHRYREDE